MYNKKVLSKATAELDKAKAPKKPKDIITDPMGQWKYPGLPTRIPGNNITMEGVGYPVLGVANNGQRKIMLPGADYTFPGADYVDEYPQMRKGGSKKTKSISGINQLLDVHPFFKNYKHRQFDPKAESFQGGGAKKQKSKIPTVQETLGIFNKAVSHRPHFEKQDPDSFFENAVEIVDPTGITSWDDVSRSAIEHGWESPETALEIAGAIPFVGKIGKAGKAGGRLIKTTSNMFAKTARQKRNSKAAANLLHYGTKGIHKLGQLDNIYDAYNTLKQDGGPQNNVSEERFKKRLLKRYPGMQGVYGTEGENLSIIKDPNYKASDYGFGNIEFMFPGQDSVTYSDDYQYKNPTPDQYTTVYNPKGANRGDVFLDMMHGMRDDKEYQKLLENFATAVKKGRGKDMDYWYNKEAQENPDYVMDGRESWDNNFIDGILRAELANKTIGRRVKGNDYKLERRGSTDEMRQAAKDIKKYLKTPQKPKQYVGPIIENNGFITPEYKAGGYIEAELTPEEIEEYRKGGYIVEDISVPKLTTAKEGGESAPVKELEPVYITPVSRYQQEYKDANSYDDFYNQKVDEYLRKMPKGLGKMMGIDSDRVPSNLIKKINDEYQYNMNNYVTDQVLKNKKYDINAREEWVDKLAPSEYAAFANSKYTGKLKPNLWTRTRAGVRALGNTLLPGQPISYNIKGLTPKEQKQYKEDKLAAFDALAFTDLPGAWVGNYLVDSRDYAKRPDLLSGELNANLAEGSESLLNPLAYAEGAGVYDIAKAGVKGLKNARQAKKLNKVLKNLKPKSSKVTNIGLDTYSGDSFTPIRIGGKKYKYPGQEWYSIDAGDYPGMTWEETQKQGLADASESLNHIFKKNPNYSKDAFDVGDFNFKQFSEGDNALKDLYAKLSKQKQLKADDFYTDQEVLELANKYKKHLENLEYFDKSNPLDPTEMIWGALTGKGNERDELFNTLYPNSFQPSFREKFLTPAQEQLLKQYNFKTGSKGSLEKNSLKSFGDMFYKPQQNIESPLIKELKSFDDPDAFFYSDPEVVVSEFRGMLNLSLDDIQKLSPEELIKYRDKAAAILKQQTIDRINNQLLRNKFTGKKAWDEITKYPGYYNKLGGLIKAQKGGKSKVILTKEHTDKKGNKTIVVTKDDGTKYTKVISKDGKVYNNTQAGLSPEMKEYYKKKAEWEDRSSGSAQPVDEFWTLPIGMTSAGVKGAGAIAKGAVAAIKGAGKSSLAQATKAGTKAIFNTAPKWAPGMNLGNAINAGFAGSALTDIATGKVTEPWKKANESGKDSDYADAITENMFTALDAIPLYGAVGKGAKQLAKLDKIQVPLENTHSILPEGMYRSGIGGMDMSKYEIKNPDFYTQMLNTYSNKVLSPTNKKFYTGLIETIKKQNGLVTERQYNELQRLKSGNFNFGKKAYKTGGMITQLTPKEIDEYTAAGYIVEDVH